jgi:hypothetical protein
LRDLPLATLCLDSGMSGTITCAPFGPSLLSLLAGARLAEVELSGFEFTTPLLDPLLGRPLQRLWLKGCHGAFGEVDMVKVASLRQLVALALPFLHSWEPAALSSASLLHLNGLPLKTLDLSGPGSINSEDLRALRSLPLTSLTLSELCDVGLEAIAPLRLLELCVESYTCKLDRAALITDDGLAHLADMPLRRLELTGSDQITAAGLRHLRGLPLEELLVLYCPGLGDEAFAHLASKRFRKLSLLRCSITDAALTAMAAMPLTDLRVQFLLPSAERIAAGLSRLPATIRRLHLLTSVSRRSYEGMNEHDLHVLVTALLAGPWSLDHLVLSGFLSVPIDARQAAQTALEMRWPECGFIFA